ncbi:DUF5977 domain-containing protein [Flavihumibacter fluvii]|uniref:DUF5977 domain-containing protein n=1 Tax=Flavihumibacter fluvii TaxID=2838157 RepID=UPI001BDE51DB|nr:DUF5977 domain-containing protein [Flavihumibacter fluvii]ULQ52150.1 DUF5977 domain-containing protein [Flavihumibacter fluvii]
MQVLLLRKRVVCAVSVCLLVGYFLLPNVLFAQVNLQTGAAFYTLPVFDWTDTKTNLSSGISLQYNSGNGLNVNEVASNIGQGWHLQAGGFITRIQAGEPDDQLAFSGTVGKEHLSKYPAGYLKANTNPALGCPTGLTKYPLYKKRNQLYSQHNELTEDKQPDKFAFQFNGKAGIFIVDDVTGNVGITIGNTNLKISYTESDLTSQGIRTRISSFTIQDVDGLIYRFAKLGVAKILRSEFTDYSKTARARQPDLGYGKVFYQASFEDTDIVNPFIVNAWFLTEIEEPFSVRKVLFNYTDRTLDNFAGYDISYNANKDFGVISYKRSYTKTPFLTSIVYPDGYTAQFNYGANRIDLVGDKVMSSIDINYGARAVSKYLIGTTYFIGNRYGTPVNPEQKSMARLCLKSVKKVGTDLKDEAKPYIFDYYMGSNAPDDKVPAPFCYTKDIWGYYNGNASIGFNNDIISINPKIPDFGLNIIKGLCFRNASSSNVILNPKTGYAKNGLLRQIVFPTGGTLSYEYAQNIAIINGVNQNVGGVHAINTKTTDGTINNCSNPLTTNYNFELEGPGNVSSLWGVEMPNNAIISKTKYTPEDRNYKYSFPFGECYYEYFYPGILSASQTVDLSDWQRISQSAGPALNVLSAVSTVCDIITIASGSSVVMSWVGVICTVVSGIVTLSYTCLKDFSDNNQCTMYYNFDLNSISGLPAQFKRVSVQDGVGGIGKTVQEFTSDQDYAIWEPVNNFKSVKQRFAPWAYGLPKRIINYDALGNKVREIVNTYNFDSSRISIGTIGCKCDIQEMSSQRGDNWANPALYNSPTSYTINEIPNILGVETYSHYTGRTLLSSSRDITYKVGDETKFVEKVTNYSYNNGAPNYLVNTVTTINSSGEYEVRDIKYPGNFSGGFINDMLAKNIVATPIAIKFYKINGHIFSYLHETVTEYGLQSGGFFKPVKVLQQRFSQPSTSINAYSGPLTTTYSNYATTRQFFYSPTGDMIGMKDEGGRVITNIYDYAPLKLVATVLNADPVNDKVNYTSFETTGLGGWTLTGGAATYGVDAINGTRSLTLNARTLSGNLTTSKPYILSYWGTGAATVSTGATMTKSSPSINGFTYYEYSVAQGTSSISITGNIFIDELRLYPANARMQTVTFDPLVGKTSECDENNRIVYYEYDLLGRLSFVRDEKSNILKAYEYNAVSTQSGCPLIYYNKLISEAFYRNNCAAGYQGGSALYSIPADKYSSTISQEDADSKAELELLRQGQAFANSSGSCSLIYYNDIQTKSEITQGCSVGFKGSSKTYTVAANKYSSIISKADANAKAIFEMNANAAAYADTASCVIDSNPQWDWLDSTYCLTVNGQLPAHEFAKVKDINPNSSTYNQISWKDMGTGPCPSGTYFNAVKSQTFYKACTGGAAGSAVVYTVPPGKYSSVTSQAAADQLAQNEINANGQAYANANGTCTTVIYANLFSNNVFNNGVSGTADFYIKFTNDLGNPISVTGVTVNYKSVRKNCNGTSPITTNFSATGSGTQIYLGNLVTYQNDGVHCWNWTFTILSGTGYQIGN